MLFPQETGSSGNKLSCLAKSAYMPPDVVKNKKTEVVTMKKFTTLLAGAALLLVAGSSWATTYTWKDKIEFDHDRYVGQVDSGEAAFVGHPGLNTDGTYDLSYTNDTFGRYVAGLVKVNSHRKNDVTNQSSHADSHRNNLLHTDQGRDQDIGRGPVPVPEPGSMALLGLGLLGLVIYGKRRINNINSW
jgi:transposase InsO family protein